METRRLPSSKYNLGMLMDTEAAPRLGGMNKRVFWLSLIFCLLAFMGFAIPNSKASEDLSMVRVFEPDEAALFPVLQRMLAPRDGLLNSIKGFIAYDRYNKGFPFYGPSALAVLPFREDGQNFDIQKSFLALRQLITVLPGLAAVWLLTYLHTGYRHWSALLLMLLLLAVPAMLANGFWWHPDGLTLLGSAMVLFLVWKDRLRLGANFIWAAVVCGILTAAKSVGAFFAPLVLMVLVWSVAAGISSFKRAIGKAFAFLGIMLLSFLVSNPFLFSAWGRASFWHIITSQMESLSDGYDLVYPKGFAPAWAMVRGDYGSEFFIVAIISCALMGLFVKQKRFLHALSLAWFLPLTLYLAFLSHYKFQYWLPAMIPLVACAGILLPGTNGKKAPGSWWKPLQALLSLVIGVQLLIFLVQDTQNVIGRINRAENSPTIQAYGAVEKLLEPISQIPLHAYVDPRLYFPDTAYWTTESNLGMLTIDYLSKGNFALIYLDQQRLRDYLNDGAIPIDPESYAENLPIYQRANSGVVGGYSLVHRDENTLLFVWRSFCQEHFPAGVCE